MKSLNKNKLISELNQNIVLDKYEKIVIFKKLLKPEFEEIISKFARFEKDKFHLNFKVLSNGKVVVEVVCVIEEFCI